MRASLFVVAIGSFALASCGPPAPRGINGDDLTQAVSDAIGDPNTCVLLVEKGGGKVVWQFGDYSTCSAERPSCDPTGVLKAEALGKLAAEGDVRTLSCDSAADGSRRVGWASGPVQASPGSRYGDLAYAAVMEGPTVLPGREIKVRLEGALRKAGM